MDNCDPDAKEDIWGKSEIVVLVIHKAGTEKMSWDSADDKMLYGALANMYGNYRPINFTPETKAAYMLWRAAKIAQPTTPEPSIVVAPVKETTPGSTGGIVLPSTAATEAAERAGKALIAEGKEKQHEEATKNSMPEIPTPAEHKTTRVPVDQAHKAKSACSLSHPIHHQYRQRDRSVERQWSEPMQLLESNHRSPRRTTRHLPKRTFSRYG